ncbi:preprotein translocase subunit SecD [[Bacillus] enclensis]|uniref:Multifunctional fusion protein n=1 Tax=[Bacillus] enclensis TaxID=1402860 RepID=A0A0V8HMY6_9BACI|nr:protein translocase subunit SecDF [[Bacillus] enclensis]KSU63832.1 preprotein translocase subunit SecD [[Bacillus] enclensis]OAT84368.1 protein translocase subunit SecDF [Bacillus sp. MKU004]SCB90413.1 SecD/SecF fusion protein [[Bacillus] enclensis]
MVKRGRIIAFFLLVFLLAGTMGGTAKNILDNIKLGLDLQGGFEVLYEVKPLKDGQEITKETVSNTADALDKRINVLGVSEPNIQIEDGNRIRVQLAGVEDQNQAREILSTEANLSFRDVNDKLRLDGSDLVSGAAKQTFDEQNNPIVSLKLKDREKFYQLTKDILGMAPQNQLVIWLDYEEGKDSYKEEAGKQDPKFLSAPAVSKPINSDEVIIEGSFTVEEAQNLASLLNAGALPVKLDEVYSTSVGAQFGQQALDKTVLAGIVGIAIIFLFMIAYYRFPGLIATITLSVYLYLVLLIFDLMNGVLTLPGIAAIILGVGMAVDANIITYERIKEEMRVGKPIRSAFQAGNKSSFLTILDANVTTILAATVLFVYGTSSVKGFATMLIVSILTSFITAVWGSRLLLSLWVNSRVFNKKPGWFGVKQSEIKDLAENYDTLDLPTKFDKFDFAKNRKKFFALSGILLAAGIIVLAIFRLNLGIDFESGSRMQILADKSLKTEQVKKELEEVNLPSDNIVISGDEQNVAVVRYTDDLNKNQIAKLKDHFNKLYGAEPSISTVSPVIGKELAKNAMIAVAIASIGIIIYVTFRFEWRMGLASVLALVHDAFFIIAFFSLTRLEVDITFIAAVLTIVGYSINDTIVTFDRIRENLHKKRRLKTAEDIEDVVNQSLRQTMGRSVNTVLTVVIAVIALLIFGSESILNFSIALLVGLIAGTYSSVFIAAQLWLVMKKKELKKKGTIKTVKEKKKWSDEPQV